MHVTACLAGQKVDVEVGEDCRSLQALKEAIVVALPKLCVEGFDVSVGGRALDDDEGIVSLEDSACLDVSANTRGLSTLALREAGREVGEEGLLAAVREGDVGLCTLYLDAGVPIDCVTAKGSTPLLISCYEGHLPQLWPYCAAAQIRVKWLEDQGHEVELLHVLRRFNKEADALANAGMDRPAEDAADFNIRPMPEDKAPS